MFFHALTFSGSQGSCLNMSNRPSVQTTPEGPGKCKCNENKHNLCDRYSSFFVHFPTKFGLKKLLIKH